jgi:hypothetical protein
VKIQTYSPANGALLSAEVAALYFGTVVAGMHCVTPILIKVEGDVAKNYTAMKLFLQNNGGLKDSNFGYLSAVEFSAGITSSAITEHFEEARGAVDVNYAATPGLSITLVDGQPVDFIWLDIEVGLSEKGSTSSINYRFVFEYN